MREEKLITAPAETADETKVDEKKETQEIVAAAEIAQAAETTKPIKKTEPKRNIWVAVATVAGIVVFLIAVIWLVAYRLNSKTVTDDPASSTVATKSSTDAKDTNIAKKENPSIAQSKEDEEKYKGWETYKNQSWAIFVRYPAGWTRTETSGSLSVTILGPSTPPGGVVLNECAFDIFIEDVPDSITLDAYVQAAQSGQLGGGNVVEGIDTSVGDSAALKVIDTYTDNGAPWKRQRVWTIKGGRAYTFSYRASVNYGGTDYYTINFVTGDMILASVIIL